MKHYSTDYNLQNILKTFLSLLESQRYSLQKIKRCENCYIHNSNQREAAIMITLILIVVFFFRYLGRSEPKGVGDPCAGCNKPILDKFLLNVLERGWHASCVRCCECLTPLTEKCFSREAKLYCRNDFFR